MTKYLTMGLLGALCVVLVAVVVLQRQNSALSAENASLERSIATLEQSRAQARSAAQVARAEAARLKTKADEYDTLRTSLINGDDNADLPKWFVNYLRDLLGGVPD